MIVTGPLSMNLDSDIAHELSNGETNGIGMRVVDVGKEKGKFTHKWLLLDEAEDLYESGMKRCIRQSLFENAKPSEEVKEEVENIRESLITSLSRSSLSLLEKVDIDPIDCNLGNMSMGEIDEEL